MAEVCITTRINAPKALVFSVVSDIRNFSKALPHITHYEITSTVQSGVGTKFIETRRMNNKEVKTELEITEYKENSLAHIVADSHGTIWDTIFKVSGNESTQLDVVMQAKAYKILPKLINPLIMGMVRKSIQKDMKLVKTYCENHE